MRRKHSYSRFILLIAAMILLFGAGAWIYMKDRSNSHRIAYSFEGMEKPIFYKGVQLKTSGLGKAEGMKLPLPIVKDIIDPTIRYEDASQSVIVTLADRVVRMKTAQLTATMNDKPFTLQFPVEKKENQVYIPIEPLKQLYYLEVREDSSSGAVILVRAGDVLTWGHPAADSKHPDRQRVVRSAPSRKAPIYAEVNQEERLMLWGEEAGWYRVQLKNGVTGYMRKIDFTLEEAPEVVPVPAEKPSSPPWKPIGGRINLTWQQVTKKTPDPTKYGAMEGLNVISPQWFILADGNGTIKQTADPTFMSWASKQQLQVWALFSNGFDPKRTTQALSTFDTRHTIIQQLVSYAQLYHLQGINLDFENVDVKDKDNYVQFVRELTPFLHEQGLVVSVDVTVKDGSSNYSLFLDRKALSESVDYLMVMCYDEHWASSPEAGSVASLPWVENGIVKIMDEDAVPSSKLILGVPFYTRIWTEEQVDGAKKVTSKAAGMDAVQKIIADQGLTPQLDEASGQHYVQYEDGGRLFRIWLEDAYSMEKRIQLVRKYDLAGVASWSRGFESPDIWQVIKEQLQKRP